MGLAENQEQYFRPKDMNTRTRHPQIHTRTLWSERTKVYVYIEPIRQQAVRHDTVYI